MVVCAALALGDRRNGDLQPGIVERRDRAEHAELSVRQRAETCKGASVGGLVLDLVVKYCQAPAIDEIGRAEAEPVRRHFVDVERDHPRSLDHGEGDDLVGRHGAALRQPVEGGRIAERRRGKGFEIDRQAHRTIVEIVIDLHRRLGQPLTSDRAGLVFRDRLDDFQIKLVGSRQDRLGVGRDFVVDHHPRRTRPIVQIDQSTKSSKRSMKPWLTKTSMTRAAERSTLSPSRPTVTSACSGAS